MVPSDPTLRAEEPLQPIKEQAQACGGLRLQCASGKPVAEKEIPDGDFSREALYRATCLRSWPAQTPSLSCSYAHARQHSPQDPTQRCIRGPCQALERRKYGL